MKILKNIILSFIVICSLDANWEYVNTYTGDTTIYSISESFNFEGNEYFIHDFPMFVHSAMGWDGSFCPHEIYVLDTLHNYTYTWFDFNNAVGDTFQYFDSTGNIHHEFFVISDSAIVITPTDTFENCIQLWYFVPPVFDTDWFFWFYPGVGIVKFSGAWFPELVLTNSDLINVSDIDYSISVDQTAYELGDTIHWNVKMINQSADTLQFDDQGTGHFFDWKIIDSTGAFVDGWVFIDCVYVFTLPPGDSLVEDFTATIFDSWFDYYGEGQYFGLMKPWYNYDSLEFDSVEFYVFEELSVTDQSPLFPVQYKLFSPYPNPFNPTTAIRFLVTPNQKTTLRIFDINGRLVDELVNGELVTGEHKIVWNAGNQPSGVYFVRLESGNLIETQKVLLIK